MIFTLLLHKLIKFDLLSCIIHFFSKKNKITKVITISHFYLFEISSGILKSVFEINQPQNALIE